MSIAAARRAQVRPMFRDGYDEVRGRPRQAYGPILDELRRLGLAESARAVTARLAQRGVTFAGSRFLVDPVPRLIAADEWGRLEAGLVQRARALNAFLRDAYGERRIVHEGVLSAEMLDEAEGYEAELAGRLGGVRHPAAILGLDIVRDRDGEFLVLEDNVRTPSGYGYASAARAAVAEVLGGGTGLPVPRPFDDELTRLLDAAMLDAAPEGCEDPSVAVLTDGPQNVAFYEHRQAAARLNAPLVTLDDLEPFRGGLSMRLQDGRQRPLDVVYRRTDEDRLRDDRGSPTRVGAALLEPWSAGRLGVVNAFGNGVADDKLIHRHVEDMIRLYLDEAPLLRSVPTYDLSEPGRLDWALERLPDLVVKPRVGHGGAGIVVGAHSSDDELERLARELRSAPGDHVAQPTIALSRHVTVVDGALRLRHVDLRPFVFCSAAGPAVMPGGLTRVASSAGTLVVNSSRDGGGKDTWVLS